MTKKTQINPESVDITVKHHNHYRKRHHSPSITWSDRLAVDAQKWADFISLIGKAQHSSPESREGEGENIYCGEGGRTDASYAIRQWYAEIRDYDFYNPPALLDVKTAHFSQLIWADTKEVGLGKATCKDGRTFIVARYSPGGNSIREFRDNVRPIRERRESEGDSTASSSSDEDDQGSVDGGVSELDQFSGESISPEFDVMFEERKVDDEEEFVNLAHRTEDIIILKEPVEKAFFRQRKEMYIQNGKTYSITHGFYE